MFLALYKVKKWFHTALLNTLLGAEIVGAQDIHLRLQTLPAPRSSAAYHLHISTAPTAPSLVLDQLTTVRNLINQSLDVVDVSTWTGDAKDANFIAGQLRLLFDFVQEARQTLKGGDEVAGKWWENPLDENVRLSLLCPISQPSGSGC